MPLWFVAEKNLDTCESYPYVRTRTFGKSLLRRSLGQKTDTTLDFDLDFSVYVQVRSG